MTKLFDDVRDSRKDIELLIESYINLINTNFLCKVVEVKQGSKKIKIQPLIKRNYIDKGVVKETQEYQPIELNLAYQKGFVSQIETFGLTECVFDLLVLFLFGIHGF